MGKRGRVCVFIRARPPGSGLYRGFHFEGPAELTALKKLHAEASEAMLPQRPFLSWKGPFWMGDQN